MRTKLQIIAFAVGIVLSFQSQAQRGDPIFPKGELSTVKNHTGNIWLRELNVGDRRVAQTMFGCPTHRAVCDVWVSTLLGMYRDHNQLDSDRHSDEVPQG